MDMYTTTCNCLICDQMQYDTNVSQSNGSFACTCIIGSAKNAVKCISSQRVSYNAFWDLTVISDWNLLL